MSDLRTAAQQALEALEMSRRFVYADNRPQCDEAIDALRAALAQQAEHFCDTHCTWADHAAGCVMAEPEEPVAKVELMTTGGNAGLATRIVEIDDHLRERLRPGQLLYTAPPQRKPLTQEEIDRICASLGFAAISPAEIVRAVERAHGIGEQP